MLRRVRDLVEHPLRRIVDRCVTQPDVTADIRLDAWWRNHHAAVAAHIDARRDGTGGILDLNAVRIFEVVEIGRASCRERV